MRTATSTIQLFLLCTSALIPHCAYADDINCLGELGDEFVDGNLMIAATCALNGTTINGNVKLFAGGSLVSVGATIYGKIEADTADFVDLQSTTVDGKVKLISMVGDLIQIQDSRIDGALELKRNRSRLELVGNVVVDNLTMNDNIGGALIADSVIEGDLECRRNAPEPRGENNNVSGKQKNQCRNLEAPDVSPEEPSLGEEPGGGATPEPGEDNGEEPEAQPNDDVATTPPDLGLTLPGELNTGTGGGAASGPALIAILVMIYFMRSTNQILARRPQSTQV